MSTKIKRRTAVILILILVLGLAGCASFFVLKKAKGMYANILGSIQHSTDTLVATVEDAAMGVYVFDYSWADENCLIAHALGGIDGNSYTNSLEAFEENYALGHRVFEVDFDLTEEDYMIAAHDYTLWMEQTGVSDEVPYTWDNIRQTPIYGSYTALDYRQIIDLLAEYPDIYIVTDTKYLTKSTIMLQFSLLVRYAEENCPEVLDRVIPQIYHTEMLDWVMSVHKFRSVIFTLYAIGWTPESVYNFCTSRGVGFVTLPRRAATPEAIALWNSVGIKTGVFTENDTDEAQRFYDMGIDMVYTDFLLPSDFQ